MDQLFYYVMMDRDEKIEEFIQALLLEEDPNDEFIQARICEEIGLNLNDLSDDDIEYIEVEIAKRLRGM